MKWVGGGVRPLLSWLLLFSVGGLSVGLLTQQAFAQSGQRQLLGAADDEEDSLSLSSRPQKRSQRAVRIRRPAGRPSGAGDGAARTLSAPAPKRARRLSITVRRPRKPRQPSRIRIRLWDVVADRVFFGEGTVNVSERGRPVLAAQAAWLKPRPALSVRVEGYADESGNATYNKQIARQRAESVRARLIEEGVAASRISVVAFGRDKRIALCAVAADCAAQNRRVITKISGGWSDVGADLARQIGPGGKTAVGAPLTALTR